MQTIHYIRDTSGKFSRPSLADEIAPRLTLALTATAFVLFTVIAVGTQATKLLSDIAPITYAATYETVSTFTATTTAIVKSPLPPVLARIAQCESNNMQYENGMPLLRGNKNRTVDAGKFQINSIHWAQAKKLGYDVMTEEGNTKMALWLYANEGTDPWNSSSKCWK